MSVEVEEKYRVKMWKILADLGKNLIKSVLVKYLRRNQNLQRG
jgi:hypothetical protein